MHWAFKKDKTSRSSILAETQPVERFACLAKLCTQELQQLSKTSSIGADDVNVIETSTTLTIYLYRLLSADNKLHCQNLKPVKCIFY